MKTIGTILKNARVEKNYSLEQIEKITKIRQSFVKKIEAEKWEELPPFPTVLGFVKSLASAISIDPGTAAAVLKRDYPPKKITISPKPDIRAKPGFGPKIAFFIGVAAILLMLVGYLVFQYQKFVSPPGLKLESPKDQQVVSGDTVLVFGSTDRDAKITVNNQPVLVNLDGKFSVSIDIVESTTEIVVKAFSRSGKETEIKRKIKVASD